MQDMPECKIKGCHNKVKRGGIICQECKDVMAEQRWKDRKEEMAIEKRERA